MISRFLITRSCAVWTWQESDHFESHAVWYKSKMGLYHQSITVSMDAPALHCVCMTEIKTVYSAQHKHIEIDIVMSTAGFWLALQQEHLSRPGAQITKSPVDQCVLPSNECAVNMINVIRLTVYPPFISSYFPSLHLLTSFTLCPLSYFLLLTFLSRLLSTCPLVCRWDLLRELQSHRGVQAMHTMYRSDAAGDALHRLQRRHLHLQLQLLLQHHVWPLRALHGVPCRTGRVLSLRAQSRHGVWGVHGWYLLWPGELPRTLPALCHLRWGNGNTAGWVHADARLCLLQ